jgi:3-hydroxybutyryl-CoA dehydrogenase
MVKERVFVVGGGTMGRGIAGLCAISGHETSVYEADAALLETLRSSIESSWERAAERGKLDPATLSSARQRLSIARGLQEAAGAEIIVEAIPESLALKQSLFADLDRLSSPHALLASNTSSLSIAAIAAATKRPDRVVGLHFFNPVASMPLVEIVRSGATSEESAQRAAAFAESLGKKTVRVSDSPGFATSRLGVALGLEAIRMVEEGVASPEDIDRAMELGYGHRMGPLKTSDLVGLDVRLSIAETLAAGLDPVRFEPPALLRRMVSEGRTGKKAGKGFYRWEGDTPVSLRDSLTIKEES